MKTAKVKDLLEIYSKNGIKGLNDYFNNPEIFVYENTFHWRIKQWLKLEAYKSIKLEIETLIIKLNKYEINKEKNNSESAT